MSRAISNDLFELIKSLSKTEKGYIKNHFKKLKKGNEREYLLLFDLIEKQDQYDEPSIIKKGINKKLLPLMKTRLHDRILKGLELYFEENSLDSNMKSHIRQIEILFQKGLIKQCSQAILRAKKIADENEMFESLMDLYNWERQILSSTITSENWNSRMESFKNEVSLNFQKLDNFYKYVNLTGSVLSFAFIENSTRAEKSKNNIKVILSDPMMKNEDNALSLRAKRSFNSILLRCHSFNGDKEKSYQYSLKYINGFSVNRKNFILLREYFNALNGHAIICRGLNKHEEAEEIIKRIREMIPRFGINKNHFLYPRIYLHTFDFQLSYYTDIGDFEKAVKLITENISLFNELKHRILIGNKLVTHFNISYAFFGIGDFKKSLEWLNKVIDDTSKTGLRRDTYKVCQVLNLIIHYELGNDTLLPYLVKSTYRNLKNRELFYKFEKSILDFIRLKMPKIHTKKERKEAFIELKKEWEILSKEPHEKIVFEYFDFISWLESKITGKNFSELVRKNAELKLSN